MCNSWSEICSKLGSRDDDRSSQHPRRTAALDGFTFVVAVHPGGAGSAQFQNSMKSGRGQIEARQRRNTYVARPEIVRCIAQNPGRTEHRVLICIDTPQTRLKVSGIASFRSTTTARHQGGMMSNICKRHVLGPERSQSRHVAIAVRR